MSITNGSINRVELRGHIGQEPKIAIAGEGKVARFTVATNEIYKDRTGTLVEDTTWHSVSVWEGKGIKSFDGLHKGVLVSVKGRIRSTRYTDKNGEDRIFMEVLAANVKVEDGDREMAVETPPLEN